jgi:hypothetical protein
MNSNDDNYLILYLLLIIIFIIIINYINNSFCNFSDNIINAPENFMIDNSLSKIQNPNPEDIIKYLYPSDDEVIIDLFNIRWRFKSLPNNDLNYTIYADDKPIDSGILLFRDSNYVIYILKQSNEWYYSVKRGIITKVPNNTAPSEYNPNYLQIKNDEYKNWDNILPSKITCGENNIKFKEVKSPKNCLMSLYKEAGCQADGTIFLSLVNNDIDKYKNMDISSIKSEFSDMTDSIKNGDYKYYVKCKASPIINKPTGSLKNDNVNIDNLLPSSKTCGTDLEANINSISTPDMCIQSLWKEAGCTSNGNLWNDISNGYFNNHKNGYWNNKTINDIKKNIENVYASQKFSIIEKDLCAPVKVYKDSLLNNSNLIKNDNDTKKYLVNSIFKLKVNLPNIDPLIQNKQKGDPNYFYLAVQELDKNCSIKEMDKCKEIFIDNKKCNNKNLSNISRNNSYRFVLVPIDLINKVKNINFTIVKKNEKLYLKNVDTGFFPQIYKNNDKQIILNSITSENSTFDKTLNSNTLCDNTIANTIDPSVCTVELDTNSYFMTTKNINDSNSIKLDYINNKILINLQIYNTYGYPENSFKMVHCNYIIDNLDYIESLKLDNDYIEKNKIKENILLNIVCIDDNKNSKLKSNELNFSIEIVKYSDEFIKKMNIISIK